MLLVELFKIKCQLCIINSINYENKKMHIVVKCILQHFIIVLILFWNRWAIRETFIFSFSKKC